MRLARIGGGQSNPTFFVDYDTRALVMRKQPVGELLPSAHAVDREYRVMRALGPAGVPVPRVVLFHAERDVVGTPFYLMEKLEGRVFAAHSLPGLTPAERGAMYRSMADTLATLHRVDPAAAGSPTTAGRATTSRGRSRAGRGNGKRRAPARTRRSTA